MPSMNILCQTCTTKKQEIEESGVMRVTGCTPLPGQDDIPEENRMCEITWEIIE